MNKIEGFAPLLSKEPKILILGSMPGRESLKQGMYYAHPQNRFFKILFQYFEQEYSIDTDTRKRLITENNLALYDVIKSCRRGDSSLDSKISGEQPADIEKLLKDNPTIQVVILNGKKAAEAFFRFNNIKGLQIIPLPSTSPANAAIKYEELFVLYKNALDWCKSTNPD